MDLIQPNCFERQCKHFIGIAQDPEEKEKEGKDGIQVVNCTAFPKGIPDEIAYGTNKHLVPYPGQENNIVYERGKMNERRPR